MKENNQILNDNKIEEFIEYIATLPFPYFVFNNKEDSNSFNLSSWNSFIRRNNMNNKIINEQIELYKIQLEHIYQNNKDDDNFEFQIKSVKEKIKELENKKLLNVKPEKIFQYKGPMYRFDTYIGESDLITTTAISKEKAKFNIVFRLKKNLGLVPNTNLSIDENFLKEVN